MDEDDSTSDDPASARKKLRDETSPSLRPAVGSVSAKSPANGGKTQLAAEVHLMVAPKSRPSSASSQSSGRRKLSNSLVQDYPLFLCDPSTVDKADQMYYEIIKPIYGGDS